MSRWVAEDCGKDCAETGGWMLVTCGLFAGMAVFLRMDMLMCMFITLSLRTFYNMVCGRGRRKVNAIMFPVYIFLAVFSKGPMGILVPLVTTVTFLVSLNVPLAPSALNVIFSSAVVPAAPVSAGV